MWALVIGPGAAFWQGISMVEIRAALAVLRVPRSEWEDVLARVQCVVAAARPLLNSKS